MSNACSSNNGGCAHLCLLGVNRQRQCACTTGYTLQPDGTSCTHVTSFLVVSMLTAIRGFDVTGSSHDEAMVPIASSGKSTHAHC